MSPTEQMQDSFRLFVKIFMGNTIPILWLFVLQPINELRFDGVWFWSIYAVFSILHSIVLWLTNRTIPDPSHMTTSEVATPIRGVVASLFQLVVFFATMGAYFHLAETKEPEKIPSPAYEASGHFLLYRADIERISS